MSTTGLGSDLDLDLDSEVEVFLSPAMNLARAWSLFFFCSFWFVFGGFRSKERVSVCPAFQNDVSSEEERRRRRREKKMRKEKSTFFPASRKKKNEEKNEEKKQKNPSDNAPARRPRRKLALGHLFGMFKRKKR